MANQCSCKFQDRGDGSGPSGASLGRVPSCLQSFDESHVTRPSASLRPRPSYTAQQKDKAIRLLDKGTPIKVVTQKIGAVSCSESNPYRWRAELRKRQRARQEWIRAQRDRVIGVIAQANRVVNLIWMLHFDLLMFLLYLVVDIIAITYFMGYLMRVIWVVGRVGLLAQVRVRQFHTVRIFKISVWIYFLGVYLFGLAAEAYAPNTYRGHSNSW